MLSEMSHTEKYKYCTTLRTLKGNKQAHRYREQIGAVARGGWTGGRGRQREQEEVEGTHFWLE